MDDAVTATPAPRTSRQKIDGLIDVIPTIEAEDESTARALQVAPLILPHVVGMLPQEPGRLDEVLLSLARHALLARSDDAELDVGELLADVPGSDWPAPGDDEFNGPEASS